MTLDTTSRPSLNSLISSMEKWGWLKAKDTSEGACDALAKLGRISAQSGEGK